MLFAILSKMNLGYQVRSFFHCFAMPALNFAQSFENVSFVFVRKCRFDGFRRILRAKVDFVRLSVRPALCHYAPAFAIGTTLLPTGGTVAQNFAQSDISRARLARRSPR